MGVRHPVGRRETIRDGGATPNRISDARTTSALAAPSAGPTASIGPIEVKDGAFTRAVPTTASTFSAQSVFQVPLTWTNSGLSHSAPRPTARSAIDAAVHRTQHARLAESPHRKTSVCGASNRLTQNAYNSRTCAIESMMRKRNMAISFGGTACRTSYFGRTGESCQCGAVAAKEGRVSSRTDRHAQRLGRGSCARQRDPQRSLRDFPFARGPRRSKNGIDFLAHF
jgi:hypothetical protein